MPDWAQVQRSAAGERPRATDAPAGRHPRSCRSIIAPCGVSHGSVSSSRPGENTIITRRGNGDVVSGFNCSFIGGLLWPQAQSTSGGVVADPRLVDLAGHDYRLSATSPGVDAAVASQSLVTSDLDGVARPQGPKPDVGAYERKP
jgi:hypothetical protein